MEYGAYSDVGERRIENQDSYYINYYDSLPIFAVADGMGGHRGGELASSIVTKTIKNKVDNQIEEIMEGKIQIRNFISETLKISNDKIYNKAYENKEYAGMGTTVTMGAIVNNKIYIGHMGDSRAYIIRDNDIRAITEDHSLVAELVKKGSITQEEALNHPQKNIITRALGTDQEPEIDILTNTLSKNDIILLCTDGLTNMVNEEEIKDIIIDSNDVQKACKKLIYSANEKGGYDNSTAVIVKFDED